MNDSSNHQLERGKREELGGAIRQRQLTHPQAPPRGRRPRVEHQGAGHPGLGEPGGWTPGQLLEGWGGVVSSLLLHSLGRPSGPSLSPLLLLPFPPLWVELHMRLLPAPSRPASVAQERVPAAPSPWQDGSRLSGVLNGWGRRGGSRASESGRLRRPWATPR